MLKNKSSMVVDLLRVLIFWFCVLCREKLVDQFSSMLEIENNDIAGVIFKCNFYRVEFDSCL